MPEISFMATTWYQRNEVGLLRQNNNDDDDDDDHYIMSTIQSLFSVKVNPQSFFFQCNDNNCTDQCMMKCKKEDTILSSLKSCK